MFADDLVLLADSVAGLQKAVDTLSGFCKTWDLQVNLTKTRVVPFTHPRSHNEPIITLNSIPIEVVKEYKYLGLLLSSNGSLKPAINLLAGQANKALHSLIKKATCLHYPNPHILSHLFDSLVRPITEYACEICSFSNANELELLHRHFCKFALALPSSASNLVVYGDLGHVSLMSKYKITLVKYWLRLATYWNVPSLLQGAYQLTLFDS